MLSMLGLSENGVDRIRYQYQVSLYQLNFRTKSLNYTKLFYPIQNSKT
jgi:hypothetical protein